MVPALEIDMKLIPETPQEMDLAHRRLLAIQHLLGPVTIVPQTNMQSPHKADARGGGQSETRETQV